MSNEFSLDPLPLTKSKVKMVKIATGSTPTEGTFLKKRWHFNSGVSWQCVRMGPIHQLSQASTFEVPAKVMASSHLRIRPGDAQVVMVACHLYHFHRLGASGFQDQLYENILIHVQEIENTCHWLWSFGIHLDSNCMLASPSGQVDHPWPAKATPIVSDVHECIMRRWQPTAKRGGVCRGVARHSAVQNGVLLVKKNVAGICYMFTLTSGWIMNLQFYKSFKIL